MDPTIINERTQEFRGTRYYRCGPYYRRNGRLLHRDVWAFNNDWRGPPPTFEVHHKDRDTSNNLASNLILLTKDEHMEYHQKRSHDRVFPIQTLAAAAEWHRSAAGIEWHRLHYDDVGRSSLHQRGAFTCQHCGNKYETAINGRNRFCSNACKTYARQAIGVDNVERICVVCCKPFVVNRYRKNQTCSRTCGFALSGSKRRGSRRRLLPNSTGGIGLLR